MVREIVVTSLRATFDEWYSDVHVQRAAPRGLARVVRGAEWRR